MNNLDILLHKRNDDKVEYYDIGFVQKRIFLLSQRDKKISGWNISCILEITKGELNYEKLNLALNKVINRHESLRTSFHMIKGEVKQVIHDKVDFTVDFCNDGYGLEYYINMLAKSFDLGCAPLMWAKIATTSDSKNYFIICLHHIIADEISLKIILDEMISYYHDAQVDKEPIQYKEFSALQNKNYFSGSMKQQEDYWLNVFNRDLAEQKLITLYHSTREDVSGGDRLFFDLGMDLSAKVRKLVREKHITCYWYLMSIFFVFMSKHLYSDDILIGVTISGRYYPRFAKTVGMFLNILPLRICVDQNIQFMKFIDTVKKCFIEAYENQEYPFECLCEKLGKHGKVLELNTSFQMHTTVLESVEVGNNIKLKPIDNFYKTSVQDIVLGLYEKENNICFYLNYNISKFKKETIETLIQSYKKLVRMVINNPNIMINDLVVDEERCHTLINNFIKPFEE